MAQILFNVTQINQKISYMSGLIDVFQMLIDNFLECFITPSKDCLLIKNVMKKR